MIQDLSKFKVPPGFRGKNLLTVQLWWAVDSLFFKTSPQFMYKFRSNLLRLFGAKIGKNVLIRPTATITYPWKICIGNNSWIGDYATLYSLGEIFIGKNSVISQKSYICAADHDYKSANFDIRSKSIYIGDNVWIATDVFIAPGVIINNDSVIGARSSVFSDMPANFVCTGNPCKPIKKRIFEKNQTS